MRVVKHIVSYEVEPNVNIYVLSDGEFIFHAVDKANYRNTFEEKDREHPMNIVKEPWVLYDISNPDWIFKRTNGNVEQIMVLTEINRMKISELS